jgi:AmmeMemoRadiSam system protein B
MRPKLRNVQPQWIEQDGRPVLLLRDPLGVSDKVLAVPQRLAPLLAFCDGTRDESALLASLAIRAGVRISLQTLSDTLRQLDDALMLDNERFAAAQQAALEAYRSAAFRAPASAGTSYPASVEELQTMLDGYAATDAQGAPSPAIRGIISPHIDYRRGGSVYGKVWAAGAALVREAEVAVVFGTDHMGDFSPFTLTRQNYATPLGVLPTDVETVNAVADAIGQDPAFRDEFHHKNEHSVELAAVWLQYVREGEPCALVPILSGSFERFVAGDGNPGEDPTIGRGVDALRQVLEGRRAVVIAAADLAHTGPAFGDPLPADPLQRALAKRADDNLIRAICSGDANDFFEQIRAEGDRRHVCGLPPIYLALRLLESQSSHLIAYDQAPGDAQGTSFVSFCGMTLE